MTTKNKEVRAVLDEDRLRDNSEMLGENFLWIRIKITQ